MKKIILAVLALSVFSTLSFAGSGLDNFMANLNVQAQTDSKDFAVRLSTQFGVPETQVYAVINSVREPADAFICLQLGQWTQYSQEKVLKAYDTHQKKGWGAMAKSMGIKPGSKRFHDLKNGNLIFSGKPNHGQHDNHGKGKAKSKGNSKGHKD